MTDHQEEEKNTCQSEKNTEADSATQICGRLSLISKSLAGISDKVEPDFLKLGQQLQDVYSEVTAMNTKTGEIGELIRELTDRDARINARRIIGKSLEAFDNSRKEARDHLNPVMDVVSDLGRLNSMRGEIESISRYLRAVALNIFVETSRSRESDKNFSIIAREIKQLSDKINSLANDIRENSEEAKASFTSVEKKISESLDKLDKFAAEAEKKVSDSVRETGRLMDISAETMERAGSRSREISQQIGEIVMGIQFHDNMRQRLEHITASINEAESVCLGTSDGAGEYSIEERLGFAHSVATLENAQIKDVVSEVDDVYRKNINAFDELIKSIVDLGESFERPGFEGDEKNRVSQRKADETFALLASALSHLSDLRGEGDSIVEQLQDTSSKASETASSLSDLLDQIQHISSEAHNKALNAFISSNRMGYEGRTLKVLAQEMKELSGMSAGFVASVEEILNSIDSSAKALGKGADVNEDEKSESDASGTLDDVISKVSEAYVKYSREAGDIHEVADVLKNDVAEIKSGLDFLPVLQSELNGYGKQLEEMCQSLSRWEGMGEKLISDETIGRRYTMEQERLVHEHIIAGGASVAEDDVSLFDTKEEAEDIELFDAEGEAGDIELFDAEEEAGDIELFDAEEEAGDIELFDAEDEAGDIELFDTEGDAGNVELFEDDHAAGSPEDEKKKAEHDARDPDDHEKPDEDDLGDNIELF